ncbi:nicotinamide-nucleotide amidohydrolase family protein [Neisseriaceae bacterium PsAf]|nr:nicotinamide-nucleotide amidohydrolase family protein [Neisseriaceae bacterium PsAf]MCV2502805.1 CinA family protein [Neisseriaceae bacterium]
MHNSLLNTLSELLVAKNLIITTAESCTGGLLANYLTNLSGSSQWFELGFVTYANSAKSNILGVKPETLAQYGAVSKQTVVEMATGALEKSAANIAISISGIAGPTGATPQYPVGSVWFAIASQNTIKTYLQHFSGDRLNVREKATQYAIHELINFIQD